MGKVWKLERGPRTRLLQFNLRAEFQCAFFLSASALLRGVSLLSHPHLHSVLTPMRPTLWEEREEREEEEEEEGEGEVKRGM